MCSFITQHNATDVARFEGACNWHADCRNVHQSCCPWIECSFLYRKPSPKAFQRIWQYIQPVSQPQTPCIHTSPGPPHPASSPPSSSETSHPDSCCNNRFVQPKNFCTNCQKPSQRSSSACSSSSSGYLTWLQFVVVSDLSGQMLTFDGAWHFGEVFSSWMNPGFSLYRAEGRQHVCVVWMIGLLNVVDLVAHGGGGVMVWAGVCYGQHHM